MNTIQSIHTKPFKTFLMSNKVRRAEIVVGTTITRTKGTITGIFAISENDSHRLFADAQGAELETLILAAEIVHSHMYFITDEALRVALLIAMGDDQTDETSLQSVARHYLAQGMTVSGVRDLVTKARENIERRTTLQTVTVTARNKKLARLSQHLHNMSKQAQTAVA